MTVTVGSTKPKLYTPMPQRAKRRVLLLAMLCLCALNALGCAGLRVPRIDPSGERIFIWPKDQVAPAATNLQAPTVFTDPVFPAVAPVPGAQIPAGVAGLLPPLPQDHLSITPGRVLAPVGSEVILKAGLCTRDNFLLTDSKVDWLLARDGVGEFVSLGGRGWLRDPWLPWNKPKKIDNQYATGYTAKVPLRITRGTADLGDDVQVEPGESWVSITSPVEGTSRITAVAPEIETWAQRRATATIYWVDVQWTMPPPAVTAGGSQVLTTTVLRQTDGTPIEGWLVRYEVADGSGALSGNQSGQVVEVPTDAKGRASIDVTPTGSAGSVTRINTQIVRPERFANSNAPRLVIANGSSTINWTNGGSDYLPPPDDLSGQIPSYPLPSRNPAPPIQSTPDPALARRGPKLELEVHRDNAEVLVGGQARFEVVIRNVGDSPATGVVLRDAFDPGLTHPNAPPGVFEIENANIGDIAAGDSRSLFLTFGVNKAGQLRQVITATSREGARAERQAILNVQQPQLQRRGRLEVRADAPRQRNVGESALFTLSIKNVGEAALTDIEILDEFDRALVARPTQQGYTLRNGNFVWAIPRLEVGETKNFDVNCQCMAPKLDACRIVLITADTGTGPIRQAEKSCIEIRPSLDVEPPVTPAPGGDVLPGVTPGGAAAANPNATGALRMEVLPSTTTVRAGAQMRFEISISNSAATPDEQVQLRVLFPPELSPNTQAITNDARVQWQFQNGELLFAPIETLRPNERLVFVIPCIANRPGVRNVTAQLISRNMPQPIEQTKKITILSR